MLVYATPWFGRTPFAANRLSRFLGFFPLNPRLVGVFSLFFQVFFVFHRAQNDENVSLYKKYYLGLLRAQNRLNFTKTQYLASLPKLLSVAALSYWIIGCLSLAL